MARLLYLFQLIIYLLLFIFFPSKLLHAQSSSYGGKYVVHFTNETTDAQKEQIGRELDAKRAAIGQNTKLEVWEFNPGRFTGTNAEEKLVDYIEDAEQKYGIRIEPDYLFSSTLYPDDPYLSEQWPVRNSGPQGGGTGLAAAWDITQGSDQVVVGIIDTGIDYGHEDLQSNIWQNLAEDADGDGHTIEWIDGSWKLDPGDLDGIDADQNGYTDDLVGWDFVNDDNDPFDDNGHGTHVAGIMGAKGNNSTGISGVSWNSKLMALKAFDAAGKGTLSDILPALEYARKMGVNLTNNSWGGSSYSIFLFEEIMRAKKANQTFVAAAGNDGKSLKQFPSYPAAYEIDNILVVGAINEQGQLAGFSNFGNPEVDILAPGAHIFSTLPGNQYGFKSGTSMAAPIVSGAICLLLARYPSSDYKFIKETIICHSDKSNNLKSYSLSEGSLEIHKALKRLPINNESATFGGNIPAFKIRDILNNEEFVWAGTDKGLIKINKEKGSVLLYDEYQALNGNQKNFSDVYSIAIDRYGNKWLGFNGHGLLKLDSVHITHYSKDNSDLPDKKILSLAVDQSGLVWAGSEDGHLLSFNRVSWQVRSTESSPINGAKIKDIEIDEAGKIWMATEEGLAMFDPVIDSTIQYSLNAWTLIHKDNSALTSNNLKGLSIDSKNHIWIASDKGIARFDHQQIEMFDEKNSGLPKDNIKAIHIDSRDNIWLGTDHETIVWTGLEWTIFTPENSDLPDDKILSFGQINSAQLWVGTDKGLASFSTVIEAMFDVPDVNCIDSPVEFNNYTSGATSHKWIINGQEVSSDSNWVGTFNQPGTYTVSLIASNGYLYDTLSRDFVVKSPPHIELGPDTTYCANAFVLDAGVSGLSYHWYDKQGSLLDSTQNLIIKNSGTYYLTVEDACGDTMTDSIRITLNGDCVWPGGRKRRWKREYAGLSDFGHRIWTNRSGQNQCQHSMGISGSKRLE